MTPVPTSLARVPNLLTSQLMLGSINRTNSELVRIQNQLGSGLAIARPSDDPVGAATSSVLDDTLERRTQVSRNLAQADSLLGNVDQAIGDVNELILEAKAIGLSQIGIGSDSVTRRNQAEVIDSLVDSLTAIANRDYRGIHFFGGEATGADPLVELNGGLQYRGRGDGMRADIGLARSAPITVSAEDAFGAFSSRVRGASDLDPDLLPSSRLVDLAGARDQGIALGAIDMSVNGIALTVDLTGADTIGDVATLLQDGIRTIDAGAVVRVDPAGRSGLEIIPTAGPVVIGDSGTRTTATDLGLTGTFPAGAGAVGGDLNPRIVSTTRLDSLDGLTVPLGSIRLRNGDQARVVDLSAATTVQDLVNAVESLGIGVRVSIDPAGDRLTFRNEVSGARMTIEEVAGGSTATELGVRSFGASTLLSDFNDGRGVGTVTGGFDPVSGLPDPARDVDFRVTLRDGRTFDVDIAGAITVQDVIDRTEAAATGAGIAVPGEFAIGFVPDGNGLQLTDGTGGAGDLVVSRRNNSGAAADLGILGSAGGAVLAGSDQARVAADGLFTHLIDLRDALLADDEAGIEVATGKLDEDVVRAAEARADVGVRARRVAEALVREEDLTVRDESLRSRVRDLDFTAAATRYALLQQQLQAGLTVTSRAQQLSLLDFLR